MRTGAEEKTFVGLPVKGEVTYTKLERGTQKTSEEFKAALGAAFAAGAVAVVWTQYTPYFNDGEPCEFSVGGMRAALATAIPGTYTSGRLADNSETDEDEDGDGEGFPLYDVWDFRDEPYTPLLAALRVLEDDAFEDVLYKAFGDHCQVIARPDGFTVREYEHD